MDILIIAHQRQLQVSRARMALLLPMSETSDGRLANSDNSVVYVKKCHVLY